MDRFAPRPDQLSPYQPSVRVLTSARSTALLPRHRLGARRAFTLVELILVLALLAITITFVAASMSGFFRGRALNSEARRLLSLAQYGQSRAVSEGVPVLLWVNARESTYGLTLVESYVDEIEGDGRAVTYHLDADLAFDVPAAPDPDYTSENNDELLGLAEDVVAIRFNPDGFFDEASVPRIVIRQGDEAAIELVPTANRLGHELRPAALN